MTVSRSQIANAAPQGVSLLSSATAMLTKLSGMLEEATTLPELHDVAKQADAFHHVLRIAKFGLKWQNHFAALRFRAMLRWGELYSNTEKNKGGDPLRVEEGGQTLRELGVSYNFSSECQQMVKMPKKVFDDYLASGETDDVELTKRGLFDYVASFTPGAFRFTRGGYLGLASSGSPEWYTPPRVFDALGCRFDLDVASPGREIVPWVPANHHYTLTDNGLEREWFGFVWCNVPFSKEGLPQWMEKFRRHGNGIAMIGDRTSSQAWQDVCGNADLVLFTNKKINFISPTSSPGNNTLGSTLVAYGGRGVQALERAAAAGLGILFKPERETRRVQNYSEKYYLTPPDLYQEWDAEFHFDFDACPHPRPRGFNSLTMPWGQSTYCNAPFSAKRNNSEGHGPTDFVRKAIEENKLGKTVVMPLPTFNYVNMLLEAGAEVRPLGRVLWLEAKTGQPHPSPPFIVLFVLRGKD